VAPEPGLLIAAIPIREDARDALVARDGLTLGELPFGSLVGTGSPRRTAQLAALGLGLRVTDIRGNVDTRISLVHNGSCDAVLLARAGLSRLGRLYEVSESLDPLQMLPAPGQGALAIECRADRLDLIEALTPLDDPDTRACVSASWDRSRSPNALAVSWRPSSCRRVPLTSSPSKPSSQMPPVQIDPLRSVPCES
jgi:hydroxymethylbilane synthase